MAPPIESTARDSRYWRDKALYLLRVSEIRTTEGDTRGAETAREAYRIAARQAVELGARCFTDRDLI